MGSQCISTNICQFDFENTPFETNNLENFIEASKEVLSRLSVCSQKGLIERFDSLGIEVSDFFASNGFVRGHSFHGKTVLSFSQIKEKYKGKEIKDSLWK